MKKVFSPPHDDTMSSVALGYVQEGQQMYPPSSGMGVRTGNQPPALGGAQPPPTFGDSGRYAGISESKVDSEGIR